LNFEFEHIDFLPALAIIPTLLFLFIWILQGKKSIAKKIGNPQLVKELSKNYSPANFIIKFVFVLLALAAIVLGVLNMRKPGQSANLKRAGVDVVIALDVSKSMLADDSKPNRLEKARQFVYKLLDELKDDRIGLVLFAGRAYLQMPLTTDHSAARIYVQNASPDAVPTQGTIVSEALRMSNSAFNSRERKFKSIVLITDGEDHDPEAQTLGASLAQNGVMVNTIGIGSPEGSPIMDPATDSYKTDPQGQTVISKLNETLLQDLANTTKGVYVRLDNVVAAVTRIREQLDTIEKTSLEDATFRDYDTFYFWFIGAALLLLVIEIMWPERKWKLA
jgi:Ca-activated chloride channel homolog